MTGLIVTVTVVALAIWVVIRVTEWMERGDLLIEQMVQAALDEPTRTEAEADTYWANWQPEMRHEEDVWFAASVLADIEDLPEVPR